MWWQWRALLPTIVGLIGRTSGSANVLLLRLEGPLSGLLLPAIGSRRADFHLGIPLVILGILGLFKWRFILKFCIFTLSNWKSSGIDVSATNFSSIMIHICSRLNSNALYIGWFTILWTPSRGVWRISKQVLKFFLILVFFLELLQFMRYFPQNCKNPQAVISSGKVFVVRYWLQPNKLFIRCTISEFFTSCWFPILDKFIARKYTVIDCATFLAPIKILTHQNIIKNFLCTLFPKKS